MLLYKAYVVLNVINCRTHRVLHTTWHTFQCLSFILLLIVDWKYIFTFIEQCAPCISGLCCSYNDLMGNVLPSVYIILNLNRVSFLNVFNPHEDKPPCMTENVLSSVGLISGILEISHVFSHYLNRMRSNMLRQWGQGKEFEPLYFKILKCVVCDFLWITGLSFCLNSAFIGKVFLPESFFFPPNFPHLSSLVT